MGSSALLACPSAVPPDAAGESCARLGVAHEGEPLQAAAILAGTSLTEVRGCFRPTVPAFPLWADGHQARRYLYLPPGMRIDGTDLEHFVFPVGTRALKLYLTADQRPIELRVLERTPTGYRMGSYVYSTDGKGATYTERGGRDQLGLVPAHEIPSAARCGRCHGGEPGRILGISALQLARGGTPTLDTLLSEQRLTLPGRADVAPLWADAVAERALGGLHANCGHCHADTGEKAAMGLILRLDATARDGAASRLVATNVSVALTTMSLAETTQRVVPGAPERSGTWLTLARRGKDQMPDLSTQVRNLQLEEEVAAWIRALK